MHQYCLIGLLVAALLVGSNAISSCKGYSPDQPFEPINWEIGTQDSDTGGPVYFATLKSNIFTKYDSYVSPLSGWYSNLFNFWINSAPLVGGKNFSSYEVSSFVPTADFSCQSEYSGVWGPVFPDYRGNDYNPRAQYDNLGVYVQFSAPTETSYIRVLLFIANTGQTTERVRTSGYWLLTSLYAADISPVTNEGRYMTMWPWNSNDLGSEGIDIGTLIGDLQPMSIHVRGPKARNKRSIISRNLDNKNISPSYYSDLAPGEEMVLMFIASFGRNKSSILKNSAEIDTEPAYIFHALSPDELSNLHNWGGCAAVLGPQITVNINAPSQCSNDVQLPNFSYRVVTMAGNQLIAPQSSTTITVPNDIGQLKHQLYYKNCFVREDVFTACDTYVAPPTTPISSPISTPIQSPVQSPIKASTSSASVFSLNVAVVSLFAIISSMVHSKSMAGSLLIMACVLLLNGASAASTCKGFAVGEFNQVISWQFGSDENEGTPFYSGTLDYYWFSNYDLFASLNYGNFKNTHNYWINGVPLVGAKNYSTEVLSVVLTASFVCDSDYSGMWGPAYPDWTESAGGKRGQFQNLEVYIHYSAPPTTSYIRSVVFIKNSGDAAERVALHGEWGVKNYGADVSPSNNDRYYTMFPWLDGDLGQFGDNPGATFAAIVCSLHVAGPKGREATNQAINPDFGGTSYYVSPVSYTTLDAGEEMALMYITSYGRNKGYALQHAADIDTEPVHIFHGLNADQLSLIRNWGACQSVLAPDVNVTIATPTQCSTGLTNDFTVSTVTSRSDFMTDFTHRVISALNDAEVVPAQSSTTLAVRNNIGPLKHQLWYKQCLIKETEFTSCTTSA